MEGTPSAPELIEAIAETMWAAVSAQELAVACDDLGMPAARSDASPWTSKRAYVRNRLAGLSTLEVVGLARAVAGRYDNEELAAIASGGGPPLGQRSSSNPAARAVEGAAPPTPGWGPADSG